MTDALELRSCRVCGCTDTRACVDTDGGPCRWVEGDLCSGCAPAPADPPAIRSLEDRLADCLARCIDTPLLQVREVGHGGHLELTLGAFNEELADEACRLLEEAGR